MKKIINILSVVLMAVSLSSCNNDDVLESGSKVTLKLDISAAALSDVTSRALGDPGIAEFFEKPTEVHVFMAVGDPKTPNVNPVYKYTVTDLSWVRSADSLYYVATDAEGLLFSLDIQADPAIKFESATANQMRAYLVASFSPITFDNLSTGTYGKCQTTSKQDITEQQLLNLQLFASGTSGGYSSAVSLRDLYSSPYNLRMEGTSFAKLDNPQNNRSRYYGTATEKDQTSVTFRMTLYHTAAKVDFQWNTASPTQSNVMQYAIVANAPQKGYAFKQAETVPGVGRYSKILLDDTASAAEAAADDDNNNNTGRYANADQVNPSNQWSGRAYTYVLQPGDLGYKIKTAAKLHDKTAAIGTQGNSGTNDIFAAWYKLDFNISE